MEQLNILVTGGAGFIGSHLVDALVERGHRVRVLDALVSQVHADGAPRYLNPAAEFIRGDVCDPAAVSAALQDIDVVFHKAAEVGVGQSMYEIVRYVRANDLGTSVLLEELMRNRKSIKYREDDIRDCIGDISSIRTKLGYEPQVSLENGIPQLID